MRSKLPGATIVEHVNDAPSPLMGIGAVLMLVGIVVMMIGPLGEIYKNPLLTYIGVAGAIIAFTGIAFIGIGYALLECRLKKQGKQ